MQHKTKQSFYVFYLIEEPEKGQFIASGSSRDEAQQKVLDTYEFAADDLTGGRKLLGDVIHLQAVVVVNGNQY